VIRTVGSPAGRPAGNRRISLVPPNPRVAPSRSESLRVAPSRSESLVGDPSNPEVVPTIPTIL
jgi:hypothetical protein